ncbi:hypothetical protein Q8A67_012715 [Cirrhinus molitorella]|uniref:Uncharacterized protein n=1 Tax=Cirrhinus molitorella TaxID=172907 RepID=A0AA88TMN6_9TELE|nr:hypothetical protein Q8A67_012715 [Cirrhinus molitorella]
MQHMDQGSDRDAPVKDRNCISSLRMTQFLSPSLWPEQQKGCGDKLWCSACEWDLCGAVQTRILRNLHTPECADNKY